MLTAAARHTTMTMQSNAGDARAVQKTLCTIKANIHSRRSLVFTQIANERHQIRSEAHLAMQRRATPQLVAKAQSGNMVTAACGVNQKMAAPEGRKKGYSQE